MEPASVLFDVCLWGQEEYALARAADIVNAHGRRCVDMVDGRSPLFAVCARRDLRPARRLLRLLVAHGAQVDAMDGADGYTPLLRIIRRLRNEPASRRALLSLVQELLRLGADPNLGVFGKLTQTPLEMAAGDCQVIACLLDGHASPLLLRVSMTAKGFAPRAEMRGWLDAAGQEDAGLAGAVCERIDICWRATDADYSAEEIEHLQRIADLDLMETLMVY